MSWRHPESWPACCPSIHSNSLERGCQGSKGTFGPGRYGRRPRLRLLTQVVACHLFPYTEPKGGPTPSQRGLRTWLSGESSYDPPLLLRPLSSPWPADVGDRSAGQLAGFGSAGQRRPARCGARCGGIQIVPEALADYAKAANFQNNEAFDLAADAWQAFLQKHGQDPKAIEAQYQLGVCQLQLKNYAQARKVLQAVVDSKTSFDRREDAYLNLGWTLYSLALKDQPELFAEADRIFAGLLQEFPESQYRDQALFFRGESLYLQAKRDEAAAAYQQVVDEFSESELRDDSIYALGVTLEELGRFEEAGQLYDLFLGEFPQHELLAEVRMRKAETILRAKDYAAAAKRFAEVAAISGFTAADHALYRQAFCVARLEKFEEAGNLFARITREFPKSNYQADATISAARSYFRAGKLELAAEWFDKVLTAQNQHAAEAAHWRARLFLKQDQPQLALKLIEKYLPLAKEDSFFVNLKMDQADAIYELPKRRGESIPLYAKLVEEHPRHLLAPQALYNAAFAALQLKQYKQGLAYAQQFLENKDYAAHSLLPDVKHVAAECQLQLGQSQGARRDLRGARAIEPRSGGSEEMAGSSGDLRCTCNRNIVRPLDYCKPLSNL